MAWIELDDGVWEHHKIGKICAALKISEVQAVGHLVSLWHFVLRNAWRDANLEAWGEFGIEKAARWQGEPGKFISVARDCRLIDGFTVHGWMERAGRLVYDRLRKEAERSGNVHKLSGTKSGLSTSTVPNRTVPNRTVPNPTLPKNMGFDALWAIYPNKDGRKSAETYFKASVKTPQDYADIQKALNNYLKSEKVKKGFIKNGSTFFNNWRDWIDYQGPVKPSSAGAAAPIPGKYDGIGSKA